MHKMLRLRVFWPPRLAPYLNRAATERTSLRSSPDNNNAKQIVRWKLARIICSMCLMSTHTHHGVAAVAELPAPRRTSSLLSCAAALVAASAGSIGRVRLTMSMPVAVQTIRLSFRCWDCSPRDYISNSNDEHDGRKVSDDGAVLDDSSRGSVVG
jgi:hypothetical protein